MSVPSQQPAQSHSLQSHSLQSHSLTSEAAPRFSRRLLLAGGLALLSSIIPLGSDTVSAQRRRMRPDRRPSSENPFRRTFPTPSSPNTSPTSPRVRPLSTPQPTPAAPAGDNQPSDE
jgi:hypothetical protein